MITLCHTLLGYSEYTKMNTVLIVCPLNTVLNWQHEWVMWQEDMDDDEAHTVNRTLLLGKNKFFYNLSI